jgi:hypothetical protein
VGKLPVDREGPTNVRSAGVKAVVAIAEAVAAVIAAAEVAIAVAEEDKKRTKKGLLSCYNRSERNIESLRKAA